MLSHAGCTTDAHVTAEIFGDSLTTHFNPVMYGTGHSAGVAELAATAASRCRLDAATTTMLRRAALVHDLGRVAIGPKVWQKPGPLNADEWEEVRLHPYHTERVLSRSPFLSALGELPISQLATMS
jgi:HD-GYP domain-containing protein (c-di-GMP phosphodiesterase class II)